MEQFDVRTRIVSGDRLSFFGHLFSKVLVVTDSFIASSGKVSYVTDRLAGMGIEFRIFAEVCAEPDIGVVTKGLNVLAEYKPEGVIAIGGGAAIDAAKAIVFAGVRITKQKKPFFIAIPTTSGTGSEVSKFAVITDPVKEVKYPLADDSMLPDAAVLDASLVISAPPSVTADTGMDVFTHAVEALVSREQNDFTDACAEKAISLVHHNLMRAYKSPEDLGARQGMHNASCLAGIAFSNSGLGLNHAMAHTLGAHFHIPHGRANAILLPYVMSFNAGCTERYLTDSAERYAGIARLLHLESSSIRQSTLTLVRTIRRYVEKMNMPGSIRAAGVTAEMFEAELEEMAEAALADRCTASNPRNAAKEQIKEIYRRAYAGKIS